MALLESPPASYNTPFSRCKWPDQRLSKPLARSFLTTASDQQSPVPSGWTNPERRHKWQATAHASPAESALRVEENAGQPSLRCVRIATPITAATASRVRGWPKKYGRVRLLGQPLPLEVLKNPGSRFGNGFLADLRLSLGGSASHWSRIHLNASLTQRRRNHAKQ